MSRELEMLGEALDSPRRPLGAVMGGAKVSDKIAVLHNLVSRVDRLFIGGGMAATFLGAQGYETGLSPVETDSFQTTLDILSSAEKQKAQVFLPLDFVTADAFDEHASVKIVPFDRVPPDAYIMDIGPDTRGIVQAGLGRLLDRHLERPDGRLRMGSVQQRHAGRGRGHRKPERRNHRSGRRFNRRSRCVAWPCFPG